MYMYQTLSSAGLEQLNLLQNGQITHTRTFPVAFGYLLAAELALPATAVSNIADEYRMNHHVSVSKIISEINELVPHNMDEVQKALLEFYSFRYYNQQPDVVPFILGGGSPLMSFFGLSRFISEDTLTVINNNTTALLNTISQLKLIREDIANQRARRRS